MPCRGRMQGPWLRAAYRSHGTLPGHAAGATRVCSACPRLEDALAPVQVLQAFGLWRRAVRQVGAHIGELSGTLDQPSARLLALTAWDGFQWRDQIEQGMSSRRLL